MNPELSFLHDSLESAPATQEWLTLRRERQRILSPWEAMQVLLETVIKARQNSMQRTTLSLESRAWVDGLVHDEDTVERYLKNPAAFARSCAEALNTIKRRDRWRSRRSMRKETNEPLPEYSPYSPLHAALFDTIEQAVQGREYVKLHAALAYEDLKQALNPSDSSDTLPLLELTEDDEPSSEV